MVTYWVGRPKTRARPESGDSPGAKKQVQIMEEDSECQEE
jgi:hypothetical protein